MTGHEMPLKPDVIQLYAGSKRYVRMLGWYNSPYFRRYKQFFTDCNDKKRKYVLYAVLPLSRLLGRN